MVTRPARRHAAAALVPLLALVSVGCDVGPGGPAGTRQPVNLEFGPAYRDQAPPGQPVRIEAASLSDDKSALIVSFTGGPGYLRSDACSTDYEPWVAPHGDALDVTVIQIRHPDQVGLPFNGGCTLEGYEHQFKLNLATPFTGTTVNDLGGGTLLVGAPTGIAHAVTVPAGWSLQRSFEQEPGPPPIWVQIYAPAAVADGGPVEGPGQLVLYQALGISGEWDDLRGLKAQERGATSSDVTVHGVAVKLWTDPTSGELLVAWTLDGRSYGLIGNQADMTAKELLAAAESVTAAGP